MAGAAITYALRTEVCVFSCRNIVFTKLRRRLLPVVSTRLLWRLPGSIHPTCLFAGCLPFPQDGSYAMFAAANLFTAGSPCYTRSSRHASSFVMMTLLPPHLQL